MKILENVLTAKDFIKLYESAEWEKNSENIVQVSLKNSYVTFAVVEQEKVIGMARLLADGGMTFYLKDFVILPEFQGKGMGKALLEYVQNYIKINSKMDQI